MKKLLLHLKNISLILLLISSISLVAQNDPINDYDKHRIRVKFKKEQRATLKKQLRGFASKTKHKKCGITSVDVLNEKHSLKEIKQVFPCIRPSLQAKHEKHGIDLWYEIEIDGEVCEALLKEYEKNESIEIAEPLYKTKPLFEPNDPNGTNQWSILNTQGYGANIQTEAAWDIETGSNNVIVGIIDSGIKYTHEDLADAMWINEAEANGIAGVDDDGNGAVDDIHGITFFDGGEFTPIEPGDHGTHIAGIIGAVSNNGVGIAGIAGGNGTKQGVRLMSCQNRTPNGSAYGSSERALVYAADNGAVIVNMSYGGPNKVAGVQDAINYFAETAGTDDNGNQVGPMKGGLLIAAAGNDGAAIQNYPASYDNVISVSSTDEDNIKAGNATYGPWIDISAPGVSIYSTQAANDSDYSYGSGTSYAAPHVVGVAALLISRYQNEGITPTQVEEALLNSADNIDDENPNYIGQLGSGRLNAHAALTYGLGFNCEAITAPYATIEAESFCEHEGIITNNANTYVGWINNGDWINFLIDFGSDSVNSISAAVSSATNGGTIEIRQGSPTGVVVGSIPVESTGSWKTFEQKTISTTNLTGTQNLYFVFTGDSKYLLNLDWIKFNQPECKSHEPLSIIEGEDYCEQQGIKIFEDNGATIAGPLGQGTWAKYDNVDFGTGADSLTVNALGIGIGGDIEFRIDSITGDLIGSIELELYNTENLSAIQTLTTDIEKIDGVHDVYITYQAYRFRGALYLDSFNFSSSEPPMASFIPDPNKTYYIDAPHHNLRLSSNGESAIPETTSTSAVGPDVEWKFVAKSNGSWHIQRAAGGTLPRLRTDNNITDGTAADMQPTRWNGTYTYFDFEKGAIEDTYFITLPDGPTAYVRLQIDDSGNVQMVDNTRNGTWESFKITEVVPTTEQTDCAGVLRGTATIDACGICSGGTTGVNTTSPQTWYADADGDGAGDPNISLEQCEQPNGYVSMAGDNCPNDADKNAPGECGCGVEEGTCSDTQCKTTTAFIEAECYDDMKGVVVESSNGNGENLGRIADGDWARYNNIDLSNVNSFNTLLSTRFTGRSIDIILDSIDATPIASLEVPNTGAWHDYVNATITFSRLSGTHDVFLVFRGGPFNIDSFGFTEEEEVIPTNCSEFFRGITVSQVNPGCNDNDGQISITFLNSDDRFQIQFSLDGGITYPVTVNDNSGSYTFNGLSAAVYEFAARYAKGDCEFNIAIVNLVPDCEVIDLNPKPTWHDSYEANGFCWCNTTFDHRLHTKEVTINGTRYNIKEVCEELNSHPLYREENDGDPIFNDVQCGNGPVNISIDEPICPGSVENGSDDCLLTGVRWDMEWLASRSRFGGTGARKVIIDTKSLAIYPNPVSSSEVLNITIPDSISAKVDVISITGQVVYSKEVKGGTAQLNLNHLNKGIYMVKVLDIDLSITTFSKIIVNN